MKTAVGTRLLAIGACAVLAASIALAGHDAAAQKAKPPETEVEGVTVTGVMVPVPVVGAGAPLISAEELETERVEAKREVMDASNSARTCDPLNSSGGRLSISQLLHEEADAQRALQQAADTAKARTVAATESRVAAARGAADKTALEAAELARQAAINAFLKQRDEVNEARARTSDYEQVMERVRNCEVPGSQVQAQYMLMGALRPKASELGFIIPTNLRDLILFSIQARSMNEGAFVRVSGRISNPRAKPVEIPALAFTAVDEQGFPLRTEVTGPASGPKIKAGLSVPFSYDFQPIPARTKTVVVAISDGKYQLSRRPVSMLCGRPERQTTRAMLSQPSADPIITTMINECKAMGRDPGF